MILFLDTSDLLNMSFVLIPHNGTLIREDFSVTYNEHDQTLGKLDAFLKRKKVTLKDIHKIIVCAGPGSFTGTRVGVTLSQAIGFAKDIPVIAIPKSKIPIDLRKLESLKAGKKLTVQYNRSPL